MMMMIMMIEVIVVSHTFYKGGIGSACLLLGLCWGLSRLYRA